MGTRFHTIIPQQITETLKVLRLVHTRIFADFIKIWESAPLSSLMTDKRYRNRCIRTILSIIHSDVTLKSHHRFWSASCPFSQTTSTGLHCIFRARLPCPTTSDTKATIQMSWVVCHHRCYMFRCPRHPVSCRFIAKCIEGERGMISVLIDDGNTFVHQIFVNRFSPTQSHTMIRP